MRKALLLVVLFFVVLTMVVPAQASWVPFVSLNFSKETDTVVAVSAPQATLKWGTDIIREWSEAMQEYLRGLPTGSNLGDGLELIVYPNVNAGNNQVLGVYYATSELRGNVRFGRDPYYEPDPSCGLIRADQNRRTGRWSASFLINDYRGPQCVYFYALVRDAKTNRYRLLFFSWSSKHNAGQVVSRVEWTTAIWTLPRPTPWDLAKAMDANGVGGNSYWPDAYNDNTGPLPCGPAAPPVPPTPPTPPAPTRYVDPDAAERAHEELATGVTVNSQNIRRLADANDAQQAEINGLRSEVRQLQGWMQSATAPAPQTQVYQPSAAPQVVIYLRNSSTQTITRKMWFLGNAGDCSSWLTNAKFMLRLAPGQTIRWLVPAEALACAGWSCYPDGYNPRANRVTTTRYSWSQTTVEVQ